MSDLYKRIELLCEEKGITITEMCRASKASRASLTDLKVGRKQNLSTETLLKIANYFEVGVDFLLGSEQKEKPSVSDDEELEKLLEMYRTRPECRMLFSLAADATVEDVKKAAAIIEAIRKIEE